MLGVFLSHFGEIYFQGNAKSGLTHEAWKIGMIASPTFLILSGILLGVFRASRPDQFPAIRLRYMDRGLFLLTIGRILILLAHAPYTGFRSIVRWGLVTDAIGFAIVLAPWLVPLLGVGFRALLGVLIYAGSWAAVVFWSPARYVGRALKEFFFGSIFGSPHVFIDVFPVLPWFSVFLVASSLGEAMVRAVEAGGAAAARRLLRNAILVLSGGGTAVAMACRPFIAHAPFRVLGSPFLKLPPGPVYLALYGSIGLCVLFLLLWMEDRSGIECFTRSLGVLGRNSLFVFVLQYYVFFSALSWLHLPYSVLWPVLLACCAVLIWWAARHWERLEGNRFFTVGLARFLPSR